MGLLHFVPNLINKSLNSLMKLNINIFFGRGRDVKPLLLIGFTHWYWSRYLNIEAFLNIFHSTIVLGLWHHWSTLLHTQVTELLRGRYQLTTTNYRFAAGPGTACNGSFREPLPPVLVILFRRRGLNNAIIRGEISLMPRGVRIKSNVPKG